MEHFAYGFIKEDCSSGKSKRILTCCGTDCTQMTQWMWPKYCPWCGAEILKEPKILGFDKGKGDN